MQTVSGQFADRHFVMKKYYRIISILLLFVLTSCLDMINDDPIKVVGNVYLIHQDGDGNRYTLTKKEDENIYISIVDEKIIKLFYDKNNIYAKSIFSTDTNCYHVPYNDTLSVLKNHKIDTETFYKLTHKIKDLKEITLPK